MHGGPLLINDSDNPPDWLAQKFGIEEMITSPCPYDPREIRTSSGGRNLQEIALSTIPLDVDVVFEKPVTFSLNFDGTIAPVGFTVR